MWPLTFHFHDLISVLNHLVFGFIAEGVSPGLDQVKDLVSDIRFRLFPVEKEPQSKGNVYIYIYKKNTFKSFLFLCSITPLLNNTDMSEQTVSSSTLSMTRGQGGKLPCFGLKNPAVTSQ